MSRLLRFPIGSLAQSCIAICLVTWVLAPLARATPATVATPASTHAKAPPVRPEPPQETGFLNRRIELHGVNYRFQVYLPEEWRRDDHKQWPIILFLHGRGERGTEGMWQTQIGLPQAVRDHPDRWPFIIVMPQCPIPSYWTDSEMQALAVATLDQETAEEADLRQREFVVTAPIRIGERPRVMTGPNRETCEGSG